MPASSAVVEIGESIFKPNSQREMPCRIVRFVMSKTSFTAVPPFTNGAESTTQPPSFTSPGTLPDQRQLPEFCGFEEAERLFGLSRSHLYRLKDLGLIKSVTLRTPGTVKGRRLWHVESIRMMLYANIEGAKAQNKVRSQE